MTIRILRAPKRLIYLFSTISEIKCTNLFSYITLPKLFFAVLTNSFKKSHFFDTNKFLNVWVNIFFSCFYGLLLNCFWFPFFSKYFLTNYFSSAVFSAGSSGLLMVISSTDIFGLGFGYYSYFEIVSIICLNCELFSWIKD